MLKTFAILSVATIVLVGGAIPSTGRAEQGKLGDTLAGAWRGPVHFTSGALAGAKDLEFMYAFNVGGTMTESSNYDASPPGPPAYGVWRKVGARKYELKYLFFQSESVTTADAIVKAGGWAPGGYGVLSQRVDLSEDGKSFDSRVVLELFDKEGKTAKGGGEGTATGRRIAF
jgi:hypothetical protein